MTDIVKDWSDIAPEIKEKIALSRDNARLTFTPTKVGPIEITEMFPEEMLVALASFTHSKTVDYLEQCMAVVDALGARVERLEHALKYYADPERYEPFERGLYT